MVGIESHSSVVEFNKLGVDSIGQNVQSNRAQKNGPKIQVQYYNCFQRKNKISKAILAHIKDRILQLWSTKD